MQNLLRIGYENILLKTSVNLWGDYPWLSVLFRAFERAGFF